MFRSIRSIVLLLICACSWPLVSSAQSNPGEVGLFLDEAGTVSIGNSSDFVPFDFYVVAFDLAGQIKGYEYSVSAPPTVTVLSSTFMGGSFGVLESSPWNNVIRGAGGCQDGTGAVVLAHYSAGFFAPGAGVAADIVFCLGPSTPSSFAGSSPGYLQCDNTLTPFTYELQPHYEGVGGCMNLNPSTVVTRPENFGTLKGFYR